MNTIEQIDHVIIISEWDFESSNFLFLQVGDFYAFLIDGEVVWFHKVRG